MKDNQVYGLVTLENIFEAILQFEILDEGDNEVQENAMRNKALEKDDEI